MKKILIVVLAVALLMTSCSNASETTSEVTTSEATTSSTASSNVDTTAPLTDAEVLMAYRKNPYGSQPGYKLFPDGDVYHCTWKGDVFIGNIHHPYWESINPVYADLSVAYMIDTSSATVIKYSLGEMTSYQTEDSVYLGSSQLCGLIFKKGAEVYSMTKDGCWTRIAENVEFVISTDYYLFSDAFSQPLFLMKDGTLKCFLSWDGKTGELVDPFFEGSEKGPYLGGFERFD